MPETLRDRLQRVVDIQRQFFDLQLDLDYQSDLFMLDIHIELNNAFNKLFPGYLIELNNWNCGRHNKDWESELSVWIIGEGDCTVPLSLAFDYERLGEDKLDDPRFINLKRRIAELVGDNKLYALVSKELRWSKLGFCQYLYLPNPGIKYNDFSGVELADTPFNVQDISKFINDFNEEYGLSIEFDENGTESKFHFDLDPVLDVMDRMDGVKFIGAIDGAQPGRHRKEGDEKFLIFGERDGEEVFGLLIGDNIKVLNRNELVDEIKALDDKRLRNMLSAWDRRDNLDQESEAEEDDEGDDV